MITLLLGPAISGRADEPTATIKKVPVRSTLALGGKDLYREYCAVCHGTAGKGDGPAASGLKIPPTDLTQITKANGGKFPEFKVQHVINGEAGSTAAHGSKDMPMWGNIFGHMGPNPDLGAVRVYNLVKYIEEIQAR
jgi:mono/diheme cytochrome c family protein